jgi:putative ATP-dependent endonuclease of OLD family
LFLKRVTVNGYRAACDEEIFCELPGRFTVVVGANGTGKTTIAEALYLAHRHVFPQIQRPLAAALAPRSERFVEIVFEYEDPEQHPWWSTQKVNGEVAPILRRQLEPSMGRVRAKAIEGADDAAVDSLVLLFLRADRRPIDELAGREARLIVEALRAEQQRRTGHRQLSEVKAAVARLLDQLHRDPLVESLEQRVQREVEHLAGAVRPHYPFLGRAHVDDDLLARILEFVLATIDDRALAERLEISALGYVNLLHLAVILAAIPGRDSVVDLPNPDGIHAEEADPGDGEAADTAVSEATTNEASDADADIEEANEESEAVLDSVFPPNPHVTIVIEEPEAHLHPQLQHGLTRHLRRVVERRPEIQVVMTTHSSEVISAAAAGDLVVLKRVGNKTISRSPRDLPLDEAVRARVIRMADRHLDVTRSAALFAPFSIVVEGVTEAVLVRCFGHVWAGADESRDHFIDSLTITIAGSRIGDWIPRLLATQDHEIAERLVILGDQDKIGMPTWLAEFEAERVRCCLSVPTLEPSLVPDNEALVEAALGAIGARLDEVTVDSVAALFASDGTGSSKKAAFAEAVVDLIEGGTLPVVPPSHIAEALDFLWEGMRNAAAPAAGTETEPGDASLSTD